MTAILENIHTVLIIRSGALGDLVYSTAVIDAVRKQYGDAVAIDWVGIPAAKGLFKFDSRIRRVFPLKHRNLPYLVNPEKRKIAAHARKHPYDLVINLERGKQFHDLMRAVRAKHKIGYPYTEPSQTPPGLHAGEKLKYYYDAVVSPDILRASQPKLFGAAKPVCVEKFALPDTYIIINPTNSHNKRAAINHRAWPAGHWKSLIAKLAPIIPVVIISDKGEDAFFEQITPFPENVIDLSGKTDLAELICVTEAARAMITTDTGPAHIASATDTPVYCLIGPTPAELTGPMQTATNEVHIISAHLDCSPCYRTEAIKQCKDNLCMKQITPELVMGTLAPLLAKIK